MPPPPRPTAHPKNKSDSHPRKVCDLISELSAQVHGAGQPLPLFNHTRSQADPVIVLAKCGGLGGWLVGG